MELKRKRKNELTVIESLGELRNLDETKRVKAGVFLVKSLLATITQSDGESTELEYVLKRLVHGMGSARAASCAGFFSVLVALLSALPTITVQKILDLLKKELAVTSKLLKSEEADIYMGQILVLGSLIRSGRFMNQATNHEQQEILTSILKAGEQRSYLRLAAYTFVVELVKQVDAEGFKEVVWPVMSQEVKKPLKNQSFEELYFLLIARSCFPKSISSKFLLNNVGVQDVFHIDTVEIWAKLLLEVPAATCAKHPLYEEFAKQLASSPLLPEFWCKGVEPWLLTSNTNRRHVVLQLFTVILGNITDKDNVSKLLTRNFVSMILQQMQLKGDQNQQLVEEAGSALALIVNIFSDSEQDNDDAILGVLEKLLFFPGTLMFEKVTGTRIVQILSGELKVEGVKRLAQLYEDVVMCNVQKVCGPRGKVAPWVVAERVYAAQLLTRLMCSQVVQTEMEWKVDKLKFLLHHGMFQTEESLGHQLVETLRNCFFKVLDQRPKLTLPRLNSVRSILSAVVNHANKLLESKGLSSLRRPWTEKVYESWKTMIKVVKKMKPGKEDSDSPAIPVFHTMFLQMGLQLFVKADVAMEALQELHSCYKEIGHCSLDAGKEEDNVQWVDVAVDLMLSLLSRNTHLLRNMVSWVFPHLCPFLTPLSLNSLLQVLDPSAEEHPLLDSLSSDEDDDNGNTGNGADDEDSSSSHSEEEDDSDTEQNNEPANAKLHMAVREALGTAGTLTDTESVDLDELDEEEGNRLNEALSKAFQQFRRPSKNPKMARKQKRKDRALTHFRIRVLDLVEIYIATEPSLASCINFLPPLFRLLEFSIQDEHQRPLETRVRACISKLAKLRKYSPSPDVTELQLAEMASGLLEKGERKSIVVLDMNTQVMECCMFLARASHQLHLQVSVKKKKKKDGSPLTDVLKNAGVDFFQNRDSLLHLKFFQTLTQQMWFGNWSLVPLYMECAFNPLVRVFKRSQALTTVRSFLTSRMVQQELTQEEKDCLLNLEEAIMQYSLQTLEEATAGSSTIKDKFVGELAQLVTTVWNLRARQTSATGWKEVGLAFVEYKRNVQTISGCVKNAIKRLSVLLKLEMNPTRHHEEPMAKVRKMENENDSAIGTESSESDYEYRGQGKEESEVHSATSELQNLKNAEQNEGSVKKRKKSKHKSGESKLKKEKKMLRAAVGSEGLVPLSFANIDVSSVVDGSVSSEDETKGSRSVSDVPHLKFSSHLRKSKKGSKT